jgi:hypothetical protein
MEYLRYYYYLAAPEKLLDLKLRSYNPLATKYSRQVFGFKYDQK